MNVLFHLHALSGGGAERAVALVAAGLAGRGHRVTVAVQSQAAENRALLGEGMQLVQVGPGHRRTVTGLARLMRATTPDVAVGALGAGNLWLALARLLVPGGPKLVLGHHGAIETEPAGSLGRLGYRATPLMQWGGALVTACSEALRQHLIGLGCEPTRTVMVPNPVRFRVDGVRVGGGGRHILTVGRLVPEKGIDTLLQALANVPEATLAIAGDGPERGRLEAMAASLGLAGRVTFHGYVTDPDALYAGADLFALASTTEAFGNVVVEAMAHGLPVVATDCGGPREILEDGRLGRLVPVGDVAALAAALAATLADPGAPEPRQARAQMFSVEAGVTRYEALLQAVVDGRPIGGSPSSSW